MNMWGLDMEIFPYLEEQFKIFLNGNINELKSEFFLPNAVSGRILDENKSVKVLESSERWYGVTYREDIDIVKSALKELCEKGLYWRKDYE